MSNATPDHFSSVSKTYHRFRPDYPAELFQHLAEVAPARTRVWDCGTGTGLAALPLAELFDQIIATDISAKQLENAGQHPNIEYRLSPAEKVDIPDHSVDLVVSAQAAHWFDIDAFYAEVVRVLKPDGVIALWCYGLLSITPAVDAVISRLHDDMLGPYWPTRTLEDHTYADIPFPFDELPRRTFEMKASWTMQRMCDYFRTWSAVARYIEDHGQDPVSVLEPDFAAAWERPEEAREVTWTVYMRHGRPRAS
ncbi:class I SAM-dependent methyltransferase [Haliangium sp.]|uniref:class I SAM-dependent methyltransferase n=1 Tax=Haliangium sp. TaxID=2663208 RepID=UPI003D0A9D43